MPRSTQLKAARIVLISDGTSAHVFLPPAAVKAPEIALYRTPCRCLYLQVFTTRSPSPLPPSVPVLDPSTVNIPFTKECLARHGMRASTSLGLSLDKDISSEDADVVARGEQVG